MQRRRYLQLWAEAAAAPLPRWAFVLTLALIVFNLLASNTSAVVVSAQTMDAMLLALFKHTCGVYVWPLRAPACVSSKPPGENSAFGGDYVISLGWGVVMAITALTPLAVIPLSWALNGERPTRASVIGGILGVAGVCWLTIA